MPRSICRLVPIVALALQVGLAPTWSQTPGAASPAPRRPMTVEDLWAMARVGAPVVSPDGRAVVLPVTRFDFEKNRGNSDLWLVSVDGSTPPRQLTFQEEGDSSPAWSPDGRRLAFLSKRGDKPAQIYLISLEGGEAWPVTDLPIAPGAPKWSPDGRRLYFAAATYPGLDGDWAKVKQRLDEAKEDKTRAQASESRIFRAWDRYANDGTFAHFFALDLATRAVTDLTPGLALWTALEGGPQWDLAPDGRELAFAANSTAPPHATLDYDLWALPLGADGLAAGAPSNLTAGHLPDDLAPRYTPDGRYLIFERQTRAEHPADFSRLARLDRRTGAVTLVAPAWDASPSLAGFTADGRMLLTVEERARVHLYVLPVTGGEPRPVARGGRIHAAEGARGNRVVFTRSNINSPAELYATELTAAAKERPLTAFNAERTALLSSVRVEELNVPGAGGEPVHSLLVYPPGFDRGAKYPLLVAIHGGPHGAFLDEYHYRWSAMLMASRGYVTVLPNFHGSTGYGQAWAESIVGDHATKPYEDIQKTVDHLTQLGFVDPRRLFAAGGSYGGYLVNWILGSTDRFAALVSHAGVFDFEGQFASDWVWARPAAYGAAPWVDPDRTVRFSPSRQAPRFATPTLVLHGERDYRVPVTQGIQLYGVLQGKGVPSRIVVFPDENHWILKPQAARLWWQEFFGWLERFDPGAGGAEAKGAD